MREIKFRGMEPNGTWRYGFYYVEAIDIDALGFDYVSFIKEAYGDYYRDFDVKKETVGQFTGLHDKNGKEIYEGDIVRHITEVEVWTYQGHVIFQHDGSVGWSVQTNDGRWGMNSKNFYEVIGNIHENGDLLK